MILYYEAERRLDEGVIMARSLNYQLSTKREDGNSRQGA